MNYFHIKYFICRLVSYTILSLTKQGCYSICRLILLKYQTIRIQPSIFLSINFDIYTIWVQNGVVYIKLHCFCVSEVIFYSDQCWHLWDWCITCTIADYQSGNSEWYCIFCWVSSRTARTVSEVNMNLSVISYHFLIESWTIFEFQQFRLPTTNKNLHNFSNNEWPRKTQSSRSSMELCRCILWWYWTSRLLA